MRIDARTDVATWSARGAIDASRGIDDSLRICAGGRERFLTEHWEPVFEGIDRLLRVQRVRCRDHHSVEIVHRELIDVLDYCSARIRCLSATGARAIDVR